MCRPGKLFLPAILDTYLIHLSLHPIVFSVSFNHALHFIRSLTLYHATTDDLYH